MLLTWGASRGGAGQPSFVLNFADLGSGAVDTSSSGIAVAATYTRASVAQALLGGANAGTFGQVAGGTARSWYTNSGLLALGYMAEGSRVNLCVRSLTFNADWVAIGTPTISTGTTVLGSVQLDTIGDDSAAALEGYSLAVTFTGDAVKSVAIFMKAGTSTSSVVRLRDGTASADRLLVAVTWAGGVPTVTMTTGTDLTGTIANAQLGTSGAYWFKFATTSVTAANSHQLEVYPATDAALSVANTGTVQAGVVNEEDGTFPSSPIITTGATVTRNADVLTYPTTFLSATAYTWFASVTTEWSSALGSARIVSMRNAGTKLVPLFISGITIGTTDTVVTATDSIYNGSTTAAKFASAGGATDCIVGKDGVLGTAAGAQTIAFDGVGIGCDPSGTNPWFGTISRIAYFPNRLDNSALVAMTA